MDILIYLSNRWLTIVIYLINWWILTITLRYIDFYELQYMNCYKLKNWSIYWMFNFWNSVSKSVHFSYMRFDFCREQSNGHCHILPNSNQLSVRMIIMTSVLYFYASKKYVQDHDDSPNPKLAIKHISNTFEWLTMNILQKSEHCIIFIS